MNLQKEYYKKKNIIKRRLKEFNNFPHDKHSLFLELCFCICTPQSQAKKVAEVINRDNLGVLLYSTQSELEQILRTKTRFHKNKSRYIVHARKLINELEKLSTNSQEAREWLVENIIGLGYKEASHFLRNIGYKDLCIIDRHVITIMLSENVFNKQDMPSSPKHYLRLEKKIRDYAKKINIDVDELDLLMWSLRTGYVFK